MFLSYSGSWPANSTGKVGRLPAQPGPREVRISSSPTFPWIEQHNMGTENLESRFIRDFDLKVARRVTCTYRTTTGAVTRIQPWVTHAELANRMMKLARIAYKDVGHREGHSVLLQLIEYFIDALNNSFIKEDVARENLDMLSETLTMARDSEKLFQRLNLPQMFRYGTAQRSREEWSFDKTPNGQSYWGPRIMIGESNVEGWHSEWSREEIHYSKRLCFGHAKGTHDMNSHYFDINLDLRATEGKKGGNTYDRSSSHYSQITYWVGKKGHIANYFPDREIWPNRIQGGDRRSENKKGWPTTGTKMQPNYKKQGNFQGPPQ